MTDEELRAVVRDVLARRAAATDAAGVQATARTGATAAPVTRVHPSHALFTLPAGADTGGACVIEPAVLCTHCGYCQSFGH